MSDTNTEKKMKIIALDAMGGDNAPEAIIDGALDAISKTDCIKILLIGAEDVIKNCLKDKTYDSSRLEIIHASEVIEMTEAPVLAIRKKKDSSVVVGQRLVKEGKADAFISAGSTGAVLAGGQLIVGRIRGIERTPIGALYPTVKGVSLLIDSGANVDAKPEHLIQYAVMGSIYMESLLGIKNPKVGLLNIGVEEEKGNAQVREAFQLLNECKDINFIGNVEARDFPFGVADIIVCDAFVGNVSLKLYEGTAKALTGLIKEGLMSNLRSKIGALLIKPALKKTLKGLDASEYGGAPLLGLKGLLMKAHGSSKAKEICNSLLECEKFIEQDIVGKIEAALGSKKISSSEE